MALQGVSTKPRPLEDFCPNSDGGHVKHYKPECRKDYKQGIKVKVDGSGGLFASDGVGDNLQLVKRQATQDSAAQEPAFIKNFAHPGRGYPGRPLDLLKQPVHHTAQNIGRSVAWLDRVPDIRDQGNQTLVDHGVNQLLAVVEVVVHHGGGESCTAGDSGKARGGDAVFGEKLSGGIEQQGAGIAIGVGDGTSSSTVWQSSIHN